MSYLFHPTILRAYDIRGEIGSTLSAKDAYAIGRSFAQKLAANIARKRPHHRLSLLAEMAEPVRPNWLVR